jgi:hypothetical protein
MHIQKLCTPGSGSLFGVVKHCAPRLVVTVFAVDLNVSAIDRLCWCDWLFVQRVRCSKGSAIEEAQLAFSVLQLEQVSVSKCVAMPLSSLRLFKNLQQSVTHYAACYETCETSSLRLRHDVLKMLLKCSRCSRFFASESFEKTTQRPVVLFF